MNAKDILKNTFKNGGATVKTFKDTAIFTPTSLDYYEVTGDYWTVALGKEYEATLKLVKPKSEGVTKEYLDHVLSEFLKMLRSVSEEVARLNSEYLNHLNQHEEPYRVGTWYNDYALVVEPVQLVAYTGDALRLAIERDQSSIYHLDRKEYVSIDDLKELIKGAK